MKRSIRRCSRGETQSSMLKVPFEPSPRGISQAIRHGRCEASNHVIGPAPDCPSIRRVQVSSTPQASGETIPSPVMTTRRMGLLPQSLVGAIRKRALWAGHAHLAQGKMGRDCPQTKTTPSEPDRKTGNATAHGRCPAGRAVLVEQGSDLLRDEFDGVAESLDRLGCIIRDLDPELLLERHHKLDRVETVGPEIVDEGGAVDDLVLLDSQMFDHDFLDPTCDVAFSHALNLVLTRPTGRFECLATLICRCGIGGTRPPRDSPRAR